MNNNLQDHYNKLYSETKQKVLQNNFEVDELIDYKNDNRYGVTLVIIPSEEVKENIQTFLTELKKIEPSQYYYRNSDIHITVMSIISCYDNFSLNKIKPEEYLAVIKKSVANIQEFSIEFAGVTASPSAVMIKGFPSNDNLNILRENLRQNFRSANLESSLDKRYAIQTAHSTVVRFRNNVEKKIEFLEVLEKFEDFKFGKFNVNETIFVANDWYQKTEKVQIIEKLKLLK